MALKDLIGEYSFVSKLDVKDVDASAAWYESKLGLTPDGSYRTPSWAQLTVLPDVFIGLNLNPAGSGSGGAVATFVVEDIAASRNSLIANGVDVGPIENPGDGVQLCFFKDPDGNSLGLRQNDLP